MLYPINNELDVCEPISVTYTYDATPVYKLLTVCEPENFSIISKCLEKHLHQLYNCCTYEEFLTAIGDDLIEEFYFTIYGSKEQALEDNTTFNEGEVEQQRLSYLSEDLEHFYLEIGEPLRKEIEETLVANNLDIQQFEIIQQQRLGSSQYFLFTLSGTKMNSKIKDYIDFLVNKANS
jgi:hypothetical protein